jgi:signal transduction histidine kinase/integral membrane sensor domain MASE1
MPLLFKRTLIFLSVILVYLFFGHVGLKLSTLGASPLWLASGFAIGSLIYFGTWLAPAVFIGSVLTNYIEGNPILSLAPIGLGATLESYFGCQIILWGLRKNYFKNYTEFFSVFFGAATVSLISATFGVFSLLMTGMIPWDDLLYSWYTWWSGDAVGILLVVPLFLELAVNPKEDLRLSMKRCLIAFVISIIMFSATYLVFKRDLNQAFAWSLTPFFMILGMATGRLFSRFVLVIMSFFVIFLTLKGYGPFELGNLNANLIYVQTLLTSYGASILFIKPLSTKHNVSSRYILGFVFGWLSLCFVIYRISVYEKDYTFEDFNKSAHLATRVLTRVSGRYESLLNAAASIFSIKEQVTKEDFKLFAESMNLNQYFESIQGIGFIELVPNSELKLYEKRESIKVRFFDPEVTKQYDHHYVIRYLEPVAPNVSAIGLDIGSEKRRRVTIKKALEFNQIVATDSISLVQDALKEKSFLLLRPVHSGQGKFIGFTYAPVISSVFFQNSFNQFSQNLRIKVSIDEQMIYNTDGSYNGSYQKDMFYVKRIITLFGRDYVLEFNPTDSFFRGHSGSSAALALLLNLFLLFISAFLLEQLTFSQQAEAMVEERTKELEVSKMQLINSSKMASLGEMASGVAHEINNPLAIIQGKVKVISLMLEDLNITQPMLFQEIHKIKLTTDRIEKIVKGLRNFSRASNNDPFEPIPVQKILNETLDLCSEKFKAYGIKLIIQEIPDVTISCRPSQISQVLINLLNNSSDAIENLSEKWIEIGFQLKENNQISISITDSGHGIPPENINKIMEPFFTTKEVRKGTGLGLSIAKSIIESHKGLLWLDIRHKNTRFVIDLYTA